MTDAITPPPELVREWYLDATGPHYEREIATRSAQWGADQELEACVGWMSNRSSLTEELRAARRPKPPSLKEQAFLALEALLGPTRGGANAETIRRALNQLPDS